MNIIYTELKNSFFERIATIATLPAYSFAAMFVTFIAATQSIYLSPEVASFPKLLVPAISLLISIGMLLVAAGLSYRIMVLKPEQYKIQANQAVMIFIFGAYSCMETMMEVTASFTIFLIMTYVGWEIGRDILSAINYRASSLLQTQRKGSRFESQPS